MDISSNHRDLWIMASGGDEQAYSLLHKGLYPALYNYVFHLTNDEDLVSDLLQDVFVKLWKKRAQIGVIENVKGYFFVVARSLTFDHLQKIKSQNIKIKELLQPGMMFSAEDIMISAEDGDALKHIITKRLNALPPRQREIIYLKYYEEMAYQKIAEITGIRYQSVVNHAFRAIQSLRLSLDRAKMDEIAF